MWRASRQPWPPAAPPRPAAPAAAWQARVGRHSRGTRLPQSPVTTCPRSCGGWLMRSGCCEPSCGQKVRAAALRLPAAHSTCHCCMGSSRSSTARRSPSSALFSLGQGLSFSNCFESCPHALPATRTAGLRRSRRCELAVGFADGAKDDAECTFCHLYMHLSAGEQGWAEQLH